MAITKEPVAYYATDEGAYYCSKCMSKLYADEDDMDDIETVWVGVEPAGDDASDPQVCAACTVALPVLPSGRGHY